jgi:hypothetical protein
MLPFAGESAVDGHHDNSLDASFPSRDIGRGFPQSTIGCRARLGWKFKIDMPVDSRRQRANAVVL